METMQSFQEQIDDPEIQGIIKSTFPKFGHSLRFKNELKN